MPFSLDIVIDCFFLMLPRSGSYPLQCMDRILHSIVSRWIPIGSFLESYSSMSTRTESVRLETYFVDTNVLPYV